MRPVCECGNPAMARIEFNSENDPLTPSLFQCEECTVRTVRICNTQHQLMDIQVHEPKLREYEAPTLTELDTHAPQVVEGDNLEQEIANMTTEEIAEKIRSLGVTVSRPPPEGKIE